MQGESLFATYLYKCALFHIRAGTVPLFSFMDPSLVSVYLHEWFAKGFKVAQVLHLLKEI